MMKHIYCMALAVGLALPSFAHAQVNTPKWEAQNVRGLQSFTLTSPQGTVTLTCDPDRVYGSSSNATLIVNFGEAVAAGRLVLLASSGEQASFEPEAGTVAQFRVDAVEWARMVNTIAAGGDYAFVTSSQVMQLEGIAPIGDLNCE